MVSQENSNELKGATLSLRENLCKRLGLDNAINYVATRGSRTNMIIWSELRVCTYTALLASGAGVLQYVIIKEVQPLLSFHSSTAREELIQSSNYLTVFKVFHSVNATLINSVSELRRLISRLKYSNSIVLLPIECVTREQNRPSLRVPSGDLLYILAPTLFRYAGFSPSGSQSNA